MWFTGCFTFLKLTVLLCVERRTLDKVNGLFVQRTVHGVALKMERKRFRELQSSDGQHGSKEQK